MVTGQKCDEETFFGKIVGPVYTDVGARCAQAAPPMDGRSMPRHFNLY